MIKYNESVVMHILRANDGNCNGKSKRSAYQPAAEHFEISLFTYLARFGPRLGSYMELADMSSSGISPFSMPNAAVHCPERIQGGIKGRPQYLSALCRLRALKRTER